MVLPNAAAGRKWTVGYDERGNRRQNQNRCNPWKVPARMTMRTYLADRGKGGGADAIGTAGRQACEKLLRKAFGTAFTSGNSRL
jgi:hypothetical protein